MKRIIILSVIFSLALTGCKKTEKTPEGPTDIRITNLSDVVMNDLTVNTSGGEFNFGTVNPGSTTDYHRFDKAYPKANIYAIINGVKFKTDSVKASDYLYYQYLGPIKATYKIYIKNVAQKQLEINDVVPESELK
jgi:hypothetical protein